MLRTWDNGADDTGQWCLGHGTMVLRIWDNGAEDTGQWC